MTTALLAILTTPVTLSGAQHALMLIPLCLGISVVYKTLKCENLREVPVASAALWVTIVLSMWAVGVAIWLIYLLLA